EAKAKSSERRCQLEESLQEEQELSRHLAGQEQSNKALRASLDRTILQMEEVQASILQLEAKTQLGADLDDRDLPELAKMYRQIELLERQRAQAREQGRITRVHLREGDE
ncbi:unnamed protein product, partial [Polarella glacialis]